LAFGGHCRTSQKSESETASPTGFTDRTVRLEGGLPKKIVSISSLLLTPSGKDIPPAGDACPEWILDAGLLDAGFFVSSQLPEDERIGA
jgi:hypothetical protein